MAKTLVKNASYQGFCRADRISTCDPLTPRRRSASARTEIRVIPGLKSCGARQGMHGLHGSGPLLVPLLRDARSATRGSPRIGCGVFGRPLAARRLGRVEEALADNEKRVRARDGTKALPSP